MTQEAKQTIQEMIAEHGELTARSSVGGYQHLYLDERNEIYCAECANKRREEIVSVFIRWEGDSIHCDDCNEELESEYGPLEDGDVE